MEENALTIADLEINNHSEDLKPSVSIKSLSSKDTENPLSSILKKSKTQEPKKVIFSDPNNYPVHEISKTIMQPSESTSVGTKEISLKNTEEIQSSQTESLKILSMLNSEGLLREKNIEGVQSATDLRWKANSISSRHSQKKHYAQSPCEIFRQRLNSYYIRNMQRNISSKEFEMKKPEETMHMVVAPKNVMIVRSYNNSSN